MPTFPDDALEIVTWLNSWWFLTSEWLEDPYPLDDSIGSQPQFRPPGKWEKIAGEGAQLPDVWNEIDLRPLKDLLFAMVGFGNPSSKMYGSKKSLDELHDISAKAWRTNTRLETVLHQASVINAKLQEQADEYTEKLPKSFIAEELGRTWETLKAGIRVKPGTKPAARNVEIDKTCLAGTRIEKDAERERLLKQFRQRPNKEKTT